MERSGSELPVVYESPWRALGRDLRAVAASCVLALRRLWRRQWQGDLPTPPFWPRRQATLFWPALLLSALILLGLAGDGPFGSCTHRAWRGQWGWMGQGHRHRGIATVPSPPLPMDPAFDPVQAPVETPPEPVPPKRRLPPSASSAPILLPQGFSDDSGLVLAAPTGGGALLLNLRISEAFQTLPERERQRLAQQWWQQALGLGYEQLRLLDPGGAELGRKAVVGGGMILLD